MAYIPIVKNVVRDPWVSTIVDTLATMRVFRICGADRLREIAQSRAYAEFWASSFVSYHRNYGGIPHL